MTANKDVENLQVHNIRAVKINWTDMCSFYARDMTIQN
jgi:hypothetical protein